MENLAKIIDQSAYCAIGVIYANEDFDIERLLQATKAIGMAWKGTVLIIGHVNTSFVMEAMDFYDRPLLNVEEKNVSSTTFIYEQKLGTTKTKY